MKEKVKLVEIGPRDGFQSVKDFIPTEVKLNVIDGLVTAGFKKIQITSFVSEKAIPQMKDAPLIAKTVLEKYSNIDFFALVPNFFGAQLASESGLSEVTPVISLSVSHNQANIRRTHEQSLDELRRIRQELPNLSITLDIATVFGCPFEGEMSLPSLLQLIEKIKKFDIKAFTLCDTIGVAYPALVEQVFSAVKKEFPNDEFNAHIHDTRNMGILNSYVALQNGADSVQAAVAGLGGCPFAPGATGNTSSEDLVYMLEKTGFDTGVNFEKLLETAQYAKKHIQGNFSGHHINILIKQCGF